MKPAIHVKKTQIGKLNKRSTTREGDPQLQTVEVHCHNLQFFGCFVRSRMRTSTSTEVSTCSMYLCRSIPELP